MKKIFPILLVGLISFSSFATDKEANIQSALAVVKADYKGGDFNSIEKWIVYGLEEENTPITDPNYPPMMIYLVSGKAVLAHYYITYDKDMKVYGFSFCNCCHLEMEDEKLITHCEEHCTQPPIMQRIQLEHFREAMGTKLIIR